MIVLLKSMFSIRFHAIASNNFLNWHHSNVFGGSVANFTLWRYKIGKCIENSNCVQRQQLRNLYHFEWQLAVVWNENVSLAYKEAEVCKIRLFSSENVIEIDFYWISAVLLCASAYIHKPTQCTIIPSAGMFAILCRIANALALQ